MDNLRISLVVEPPLWTIWKSIGMMIPNIWKHRKCSKPPTSKTYLCPTQVALFRTWILWMETQKSPCVPQSCFWSPCVQVWPTSNWTNTYQYYTNYFCNSIFQFGKSGNLSNTKRNKRFERVRPSKWKKSHALYQTIHQKVDAKCSSKYICRFHYVKCGDNRWRFPELEVPPNDHPF